MRELQYDLLREDVFRIRVSGCAADYDIFVYTIDAIGGVRCCVVLPVRISEAFLAPMVDLANRINYQRLRIGNFEMHPEEGTPRWRVSIDVEGGTLVPRMVNNMIDAGLSACDRFWPALVAVGVPGSTREAAVGLVALS